MAGISPWSSSSEGRRSCINRRTSSTIEAVKVCNSAKCRFTCSAPAGSIASTPANRNSRAVRLCPASSWSSRAIRDARPRRGNQLVQQVLLGRFLAPKVLIEPGVLHRHADLVADRGQHLDFVAGKIAILGVRQVHDSQHLVLGFQGDVHVTAQSFTRRCLGTSVLDISGRHARHRAIPSAIACWQEQFSGRVASSSWGEVAKRPWQADKAGHPVCSSLR